MSNPWAIIVTGILFCLSGIYFFLKNIYEEDRSIRMPLLIILMGVVLITYGTAKLYRLID